MKESKKRGRFSRWGAHHYRLCLFWVALMPIPLYITDANKTPGTDTWVINTIPELILAVMMIIWGISCLVMTLVVGAAFHHFDNPCADCAMSFPLNAAEKAQRWQPMFDVQHKGGRGGKFLMRRTGDRAWLALMILLALIAGFFIANFVIVRALVPEPWTASVGLASLIASLIFFVGPVRTHFRLTPWCEGCREEGWGDDGPEELSPDLPPLPTISKTI